MTLAGYAGRRVLWTAMSMGGAMLLAGVLAGFGAGYLCGQAEFDPALASVTGGAPVCRPMFRFGTTSLVTLIVMAAIALAVPSARIADRKLGQPSFDTRGLVGLAAGFVLLPVALVVSAMPAVRFISDHFNDLNRGLDGILLMIPMFEVTAIVVLLLGQLSLLILGATRDGLFGKALLIVATVHAGLAINSFIVFDVTNFVVNVSQTNLPIVLEHQTAVQSVARNLAWLSSIYALSIPLGFVARTTPTTTAGGRASIPMPPGVLEVPGVSRVSREARPRQPARPSPFTSAYYFVSATYIAWPFGGKIKIEDMDAARTYTAHVLPMQLRKTISVHLSDEPGKELLRIEARQVLPAVASYDISDGASQKLAVVTRELGGTWTIADEQGSAAGRLDRDAMSLGSAKYIATIDEVEAATFTWSSTPRPSVSLDFSHDTDRRLDRGAGITLALLLLIGGSFASR